MPRMYVDGVDGTALRVTGSVATIRSSGNLRRLDRGAGDHDWRYDVARPFLGRREPLVYAPQRRVQRVARLPPRDELQPLYIRHSAFHVLEPRRIRLGVRNERDLGTGA